MTRPFTIERRSCSELARARRAKESKRLTACAESAVSEALQAHNEQTHADLAKAHIARWTGVLAAREGALEAATYLAATSGRTAPFRPRRAAPALVTAVFGRRG